MGDRGLAGRPALIRAEDRKQQIYTVIRTGTGSRRFCLGQSLRLPVPYALLLLDPDARSQKVLPQNMPRIDPPKRPIVS